MISISAATNPPAARSIHERFSAGHHVPSALTRIKPDPRVAQWLEDADDDELYLSVISIGEFCKGFTIHPEEHRRASLREWLDDTLRPWFAGRILPVSEAISERWGILEGRCQLKGLTLNAPDGLIAATALEHDLVIVTRNISRGMRSKRSETACVTSTTPSGRIGFGTSCKRTSSHCAPPVRTPCGGCAKGRQANNRVELGTTVTQKACPRLGRTWTQRNGVARCRCLHTTRRGQASSPAPTHVNVETGTFQKGRSRLGANPFLGVFFHWLGGLASGSFYVPYRGVKVWSWETFWLVGGVFSWILAPSILAFTMTNDVVAVLSEAPGSALAWCYIFGALWGFGGLTFGLTMRYLGMSLGMAVALGYCAAFGTLMPPIFRGEFASKVLGTTSGRYVLLGVVVCLLGIAIAGLAGMSKERELSAEQKKASIKEFDLKKGILVATFSGIMSACFSYGLAAGDPIKEITLRHGTPTLWQGLPVLIVVLLGGFTTNFVWCVALNIRNKTGYQYFTSEVRQAKSGGGTIMENAVDAPGEEMARAARTAKAAVATPVEPARVPMLANYLFCALAGTTWYFQFFFYSMGETQMGQYKFSSWTLHMASIIIFSTLWGLGLKEWKGASTRTMRLLTLGLAVLIASTIIVGYGNYQAAGLAK